MPLPSDLASATASLATRAGEASARLRGGVARDLGRLLRPRSVAVLGGHWADNVVEQLDRIGFDGPIWPVHPTRDELGGRACLPSLDELPGVPDATFLGVNRHATIDCVAALSAMGAGGAVCFASGFAETGDGALQTRLVTAAGDMPVLGPNCYGLINYLDGVLLWPDQHGGRRVTSGVAIISQSSNIAINLTMQRRGLPLAVVACLGNAAQTGLAELADALLADPRITALGLYVEGIDDARALATVAENARAGGKGIVALKGGRTAGGAAAAATHTAALSGEGAASSAFLAQAGIGEVRTPEALLETLKILHVHGPLTARRFCAVACSGGEAGLVADLADGTLAFPAPTAAQRRRLGATLGPAVRLANPLDYQTRIWGDESATGDVFTAMLDGYDAGLFLIDPPRRDRCDGTSFEPALRAIERAGRATGRPAFAVASVPEGIDETQAASLLAGGTVAMGGVDTAIRAVAAAASPPGKIGWRPLPITTSDAATGTAVGTPDGSANASPDATPGTSAGTSAGTSEGTSAARGSGRTDDEAISKARLAAAGVPTPRGKVGRTIGAVAEAARHLHPPFALKGLGPLHKSESGAVRLHLDRLDDQAPMPGVTGYLVEEMVTDGVAELLVGLRLDPCYGASLTLGSGGTAAELLADTVTLILPVGADEVLAALQRLRLWPLLDGFRGRPCADVDAAVEIVMALQTLLACEDLIEIEINPLILRARGAVAVDAVIRRREP